MSEHQRFNLKTVDDLRAALDRLGLSLPISEDFSALGAKVPLGDGGRWTLPNRFVVQPMEGVDAIEETGGPRDLTFRRYRRYAEGGAGLLWFEAIVASEDGRSNPRQLRITDANLGEFRRLVDETREAAWRANHHEIVTVVQITHSGRWSKPHGTPEPKLIHHNPELDAACGADAATPLVTDDYLDALQDKFVAAAKTAAAAGFDGVEMKAVHGYFTGEMLCAHTRPGKYGGDYENRTRFIREVTARAASELGREHFVTARLTMHEPSAYPYGWGVRPVAGSKEIDLTEPKRLARELCELVDMPVFNFSIGYPRFAPYMNRPHDNPLLGAPKPPEHPLEGVARFQNVARETQAAIGKVPLATAALSWLRHLMPYVAAGMVRDGWCQLIGQGRNAFAYPQAVNDLLQNGALDPNKCCVTCSMCSQIMKNVIGFNGCVVRDREIYAAELKKGLGDKQPPAK
ncbi:MAG: flavin oxidoreductase/NADH oxidase [Planctomycetes bacterium]|nr:flavin oxidoreductase/NADH oxidase [Planctomycetota bacterium]